MTALRKDRKKPGSWYYRMPFQRKTALWGVIFLLPWLLGFVFLFVTPLVQMVQYSFYDVKPEAGFLNFNTWQGLAHYNKALFIDANYVPRVTSTVLEVLLYTPLIIIFSLLCAILLNGQFRGRAIARAIFFIPIIMATGLMMERVTNLSGQLMADSQTEHVYGAEMIVRLLYNIGVGKELIAYLLDAVNNIFEVVSLSGIQILIFLAALQGISPSLYEVAKIEGATGYETFWKVTVVMVSPMLLTCTVYTMADLFLRSDIIQLVYDTAFKQSNYSLSSAMSVIYLLINVLVIGITALLVRKVVFYYD